MLLDEYFTGLYGPGADALKKFYLLVEQTYCDPKNYPDSQKERNPVIIAWDYLGTDERMQALGKLMEQARTAVTAKGTTAQKTNVDLFDKSVWSYMVAGRVQYLNLKKVIETTPRPNVRVTQVEPVGGDPAKVDWSRAAALGEWRTLMAEPTRRKVEVKAAHDGTYLYFRLQETGDLSALRSSAAIYNGDDWEFFFAPKLGMAPYRQFSVNPEGQSQALFHDAPRSAKPWADSGAKVVSTVTAKRDAWTVLIALPLAQISAGVGSGRPLYTNIFRGIPDGDSLAWSPTFVKNFHTLERMGELVLE